MLTSTPTTSSSDRTGSGGWSSRSPTRSDGGPAAALGLPPGGSLHHSLGGVDRRRRSTRAVRRQLRPLLVPHGSVDRLPPSSEQREGWLRVELDQAGCRRSARTGSHAARSARAGPVRRLPLRHRLRLRARSARATRSRSSTSPSVTTSATASRGSTSRPGGGWTTTTSSRPGDAELPVDEPQEARSRSLRRVDRARRPASRRHRQGVSPKTRPGVALPCARMLDHALRLRHRRHPGAAATRMLDAAGGVSSGESRPNSRQTATGDRSSCGTITTSAPMAVAARIWYGLSWRTTNGAGWRATPRPSNGPGACRGERTRRSG